ncbi:c-type cytochrome [Actinoplanes sp. NPDC049316]|uniref:c-type cytochrome n=1 Tax=Actinoplanes sp. NPDC049316 TaxID=3154727 RepID=UPI003437A3A0
MTDQPSPPRRGHRMLAAAAGLGVLGLPLAAPAPSPSPSTSPAPPTGPDRGTVLYQQSCASCHGQQGEGTQRGPSLADAGPASVDFQLSTGRMPLRKEGKPNAHQDAVFSESDIRALVQHVASFPPASGPPIPAVGGGSARSGRELYLTYCSACHSAAGVGATLNNGRIAPSLFRATPTQIGEAVRVGPGLMPEFPPDVLSDEEVDDVAAYVGVLQDDRGELDRGGWPLGRLGPFTEGAVAWVFGLTIVLLLARRLGSRAR